MFKQWRWLKTIATSLSCSVASSGSICTEAGYQERQNTVQKSQGILAILLELYPHQRLNWSKHKFTEDRYVNELHPTLLSNPFWKELKFIYNFGSHSGKSFPVKARSTCIQCCRHAYLFCTLSPIQWIIKHRKFISKLPSSFLSNWHYILWTGKSICDTQTVSLKPLVRSGLKEKSCNYLHWFLKAQVCSTATFISLWSPQPNDPETGERKGRRLDQIVF